MTENAQQTAAVDVAMQQEIADVRTGEIVTLAEAGEDWLAEYLQWMRDLEGQVRDAKRVLSREVHRRMDLDASYTRDAGAYRLKGQGPPPPDYDPERLREALDLLVEDGKISEAARDAACKLERKPKAIKKGINALLKQGGDIAELIAEAEVPKDPDKRTVKVEEAPGQRGVDEAVDAARERHAERLQLEADREDDRRH